MTENSRRDRYRHDVMAVVNEAVVMGATSVLGERNDRSSARAPERACRSAFIGLALIGGLGACQNGSVASNGQSSGSGEYPSLHSVPVEARPSSSIEERRQIVRTLLDERDQSRRQTAIVRGRSGLSVDLPPVSTGGDARAEDIVPDQPAGEDGPFRLTPDDNPGDNEGADSDYSSDSQFDDGGLDDFIRQLKRDTRTEVPQSAPAETEEPVPEEPDEDDVSAVFPKSRTDVGLWEGGEQPILLAAFVPTIAKAPSVERDAMIRLAAADQEPGIFCNWAGWAIAWSGVCLDEADTEPQPDSDDDVGADVEQELRRSPEEEGAGRSAQSQSSSSNEAGSNEAGSSGVGSNEAGSSGAGRERAERRLSEEDAAEAIEDAGKSALAPVTSSLEKLRDFLQTRRSGGADTSSAGQKPPYRSGDPAVRTTAAIDRPPTPERRPRRREDVAIEDRGETFDFVRTPLPAFKPSPAEPVILKAKNEHRSDPKPVKRYDPPPMPLFRPGDLPSELPSDFLSEIKGEEAEATKLDAGDRLEERSAALALTSDVDYDGDRKQEPAMTSNLSGAASDLDHETRAKAPLSMPKTSDPLPVPASAAASPELPLQADVERAYMVIVFEPETPGLPKGLRPRLAAALEDARARDQKVHIIGEASTNHLARRRATDVGAALVQLGATVEILEYDHDAIDSVDQVRLVLRPAGSDPFARAAERTAIEK